MKAKFLITPKTLPSQKLTNLYPLKVDNLANLLPLTVYVRTVMVLSSRIFRFSDAYLFLGQWRHHHHRPEFLLEPGLNPLEVVVLAGDLRHGVALLATALLASLTWILVWEAVSG